MLSTLISNVSPNPHTIRNYNRNRNRGSGIAMSLTIAQIWPLVRVPDVGHEYRPALFGLSVTAQTSSGAPKPSSTGPSVIPGAPPTPFTPTSTAPPHLLPTHGASASTPPEPPNPNTASAQWHPRNWDTIAHAAGTMNGVRFCMDKLLSTAERTLAEELKGVKLMFHQRESEMMALLTERITQRCAERDAVRRDAEALARELDSTKQQLEGVKQERDQEHDSVVRMREHVNRVYHASVGLSQECERLKQERESLRDEAWRLKEALAQEAVARLERTRSTEGAPSVDVVAFNAMFSQAKMEREQRQKAEGEAALLKGLLKQYMEAARSSSSSTSPPWLDLPTPIPTPTTLSGLGLLDASMPAASPTAADAPADGASARVSPSAVQDLLASLRFEAGYGLATPKSRMASVDLEPPRQGRPETGCAGPPRLEGRKAGEEAGAERAVADAQTRDVPEGDERGGKRARSPSAVLSEQQAKKRRLEAAVRLAEAADASSGVCSALPFTSTARGADVAGLDKTPGDTDLTDMELQYDEDDEDVKPQRAVSVSDEGADSERTEVDQLKQEDADDLQLQSEAGELLPAKDEHDEDSTDSGIAERPRAQGLSLAATPPDPPASAFATQPAPQPVTPTEPSRPPTPQAQAAAPPGRPSNSARKQLSISHLPLMYDTVGDRLLCVMCRARRRHKDAEHPITCFPTSASWTELAGHCESAHPGGFQSLILMSSKQIAETKMRMQR
ncbi:predicted protein [Postia placenta Mad-698-R]|nr:predicted protein [Postia placenta Mad-698-R]